MSNKLPIISVNGIFDASISPLDRGFTYGDGLFETCRFECGSIPLWPYHLARLQESAARLKIDVNPVVLNKFKLAILARADTSGLTTGVLKIVLTRGVGGRGYQLPLEASSTYCLAVSPDNEQYLVNYLHGIDVRICQHRLASNPLLAGIKHLNRLEHILARSEWQNEYPEGLLFDIQGNLIEGTFSNIFIVKNNQLFTPDLSEAGVAGIMRRVIIEELAPRLNLETHVGAINLSFLTDADEAFLCNSVFGIWPIRSIAKLDVSYGVAYTQTRKLQETLTQVL